MEIVLLSVALPAFLRERGLLTNVWEMTLDLFSYSAPDDSGFFIVSAIRRYAWFDCGYKFCVSRSLPSGILKSTWNQNLSSGLMLVTSVSTLPDSIIGTRVGDTRWQHVVVLCERLLNCSFTSDIDSIRPRLFMT